VLSNDGPNFKAQSRKMIEIWTFINWSKSKNHKFSSKFFFPTFVHESSHLSNSFCVRREIFRNSTQDMCRSIWCKYKQNL